MCSSGERERERGRDLSPFITNCVIFRSWGSPSIVTVSLPPFGTLGAFRLNVDFFGTRAIPRDRENSFGNY